MDPDSPVPTASPEEFFYIADRAPPNQFLIVVGGDSHVLARRWTSRPLHGSPNEGERYRFLDHLRQSDTFKIF